MSNNSLEFKTEDVVIAEDGRVTITNIEFAKRLVQHVKMRSPETVGFFDNCDCDKKDKVFSEVNLGTVLPATTLRLDPGTLGIFDDCSCTGGAALIHRNEEEVIRRG
jgi:hypothetical protein